MNTNTNTSKPSDGLWQVVLLQTQWTGEITEERYGEPVAYDLACSQAKIGCTIHRCDAAIRRVVTL